MTNLPTFDDSKSYLMSGKTLNTLIAAIKASKIISIEGYTTEQTPDGIRLKKSA